MNKPILKYHEKEKEEKERKETGDKGKERERGRQARPRLNGNELTTRGNVNAVTYTRVTIDE